MITRPLIIFRLAALAAFFTIAADARAQASRPVSPVERLRAQLFLADRPADKDIVPRVDFADLAREAAAYPEEEERQRAANTIALWQHIATLHDAARPVSPDKFVRDTCTYLAGDPKTKLVADTSLDSTAACKLLYDSQLPDWAFRVRWCAAAILASRGHDTLAPIADALRRTVAPAGFKDGIAHCLAVSATAESAPAWSKLAEDKDAHIRYWAVEALRQIDISASRTALRARLADTDREVRQRAAWALANADDKTAAPVLREMLAAMLGKDPNAFHHAAYFCGKLEQWKEPDVPWASLERFFVADAKPEHLQDLVIAAGECLRLNRPVAAKTFLIAIAHAGETALDKTPVDNKLVQEAFRAASILLNYGHAEALDFLDLHSRTRAGNVPFAQDIVPVLKKFATLPTIKPDARTRALRIAARYAPQ